jgi:hypothetical protein
MESHVPGLRMELEKWQEARLKNAQSDYSQYQMILAKLEMSDSQIVGGYKQLKSTMDQMSQMISSLVKLFEPVPVMEVKKLVDSIPAQIKKIVKDLSAERGILLKDTEKIKLSPLFIENMVKKVDDGKSAPQPVQKAPKIAPEVVEALLQEFVNNSIAERKREKSKSVHLKRRTWKG